jgi:hypothetical protein
MNERTCEYRVKYDRRTKTHDLCGEPAFYKWQVKDQVRWMCKPHGELCAGNYTHELQRIFKDDKN